MKPPLGCLVSMHAMLPVNQSIQACDDALHHHIHHRRDGENQSSICLLGAAANLAKKRREQGPCTLRSSTTTIRGTKAPLISRGAFALVFSVRSISRHRISISSNSSSPPLSTNTKPPKLSTPPYGIPGPCRQKKSSQGNCSHVVVSFAFILFIFWEFVSIICLCD